MSVAELIQIGVGLLVAIFGWSLKRNIGDLDGKLSTILGSIRELTDHKSEARERMALIELRLANLERARHQTGEHEAVR